MSYRVGDTERRHPTVQEALEEVRESAPDAVVGIFKHDMIPVFEHADALRRWEEERERSPRPSRIQACITWIYGF